MVSPESRFFITLYSSLDSDAGLPGLMALVFNTPSNKMGSSLGFPRVHSSINSFNTDIWVRRTATEGSDKLLACSDDEDCK